jgi:uncharacterized protein (TIGR03000 family)
MRRWLCSVTVVAVTALGLLLLPAQVQAQRGGRGGGGRGGGGRMGGFRGGPGRGFRGDFDRGFRGGPFVGVGIGLGGWGGWGWGGPGWGWGRPGWGWGYADGDYGAGYYSPDNSYVYDEYPPEGYVSEENAEPTYATAAGDVAHVTVRLPAPDAVLYFNGARMLAEGQTRTFDTPPLESGQDYYYTVRVRWTQNGKKMEKSRTLDVRAGQNYTMDFTHGRAGRDRGAVRQEENRDNHRDVEHRDRTDQERGRKDVDRERSSKEGRRPADVSPRTEGNRLNSDTNGRSQPNPNPAGRDEKRPPND